MNTERSIRTIEELAAPAVAARQAGREAQAGADYERIQLVKQQSAQCSAALDGAGVDRPV